MRMIILVLAHPQLLGLYDYYYYDSTFKTTYKKELQGVFITN